jgi:hypothetical protein
MQLKAAIFYARNNLIDAKQMLDESKNEKFEVHLISFSGIF